MPQTPLQSPRGKVDNNNKRGFGPLENTTAIHSSTIVSLDFHGDYAAGSGLGLGDRVSTL